MVNASKYPSLVGFGGLERAKAVAGQEGPTAKHGGRKRA
jgi:hypothetical protein